MRVSAFQSVFFCATAALVAFSIGILVARGGAPLKLGPSGDDQGVAHPKTVRVILPDTLDGQSIPGHGTGLVDRRRDLSPLYPTSPGPHEDRSTSTMAAGTAKSPGARDGDDLNPVKASALANETGQPQARDEEGLPDPAADADIPIPRSSVLAPRPVGIATCERQLLSPLLSCGAPRSAPVSQWRLCAVVDLRSRPMNPARGAPADDGFA